MAYTLADGTVCSGPELCDGRQCFCSVDQCQLGCVIGGVFFGTSEFNPGNDCEYCAPMTSTTAWTSVPTGVTCGLGRQCNGLGGCL
jgi:hypothetical protein